MTSDVLTDGGKCKVLIDGEWTLPEVGRSGEVTNSSTGQVIATVPFCTEAEVDRAVRAADAAAAGWAEVPAVQRARVLFRYVELLERHVDDLAALVSRENGKTLPESQACVRRGIEMVEFAAGAPSLLVGESLDNLARGVDCSTERYPLGVCVGITPFNFPAMVPLWMFPLAVVAGNTFVLKPSEQVPLSAMRVVELACEAGLPPGVLSLVHGDKTCVDALLTHPLVKAISFVGSTPVAEYIYRTGTAHGKRVQAAGGAKNHIFVMPDADLGNSASALNGAAFGCAGERCMAGPHVLAIGGVGDELVERVTAGAGKMTVGPTDRPGRVDMGPLISRQHLERVRGHIETGVAEGAELTLDGRKVSVPQAPGGYYLGPTVFDRVRPDMAIAREEVFGPVLTVMRIDTLAEGLELLKRCPYGNGAVIYTRDGGAAREFRRRANAGMIGVNVGVPAPMAWFPFTGWNRSFFGDLHIQAREGLHFYTRQKMTMTRWFESEAVKTGSWSL
ncbi:MAG TPA: CoA-acylating methylmalonate-semialdehyde dehydrogenase [Phycisphaerae bacterium]|nr:CoA-acylating methylmalonate-semialdehyde dehydrogenase [Phycisphaerae bacterium]